MIEKEIGERFKAWKDKEKLTNNELAQKTGLSNGTFSNIETGKTFITGKILVLLYDLYKIDIKYILTGEKSNIDQLGKVEQEIINQISKIDDYEKIKLLGVIEEKVKDILSNKEAANKRMNNTG